MASSAQYLPRREVRVAHPLTRSRGNGHRWGTLTRSFSLDLPPRAVSNNQWAKPTTTSPPVQIGRTRAAPHRPCLLHLRAAPARREKTLMRRFGN